MTEEGKKDSAVPYIIELGFESSCNEMESECPIYSFKLIAKQEHCYIEKEFNIIYSKNSPSSTGGR